MTSLPSDDPAAAVQDAVVQDGAVSDPATEGAVVRRPRARARPSAGQVAGSAVTVAALVALDGWVGGGVAVVIAAVLLARLPARLLGAIGVVALAAVPVTVLLDGLPGDAEVSPLFVSRSLWPHHLTFAGLALVAAWVVLDLGDHLAGRARPAPTDDRPDDRSELEAPPEVSDAVPVPAWGPTARVAAVAVVAVGAVVASVGVILQ